MAGTLIGGRRGGKGPAIQGLFFLLLLFVSLVHPAIKKITFYVSRGNVFKLGAKIF